jgi:hypothetical protein
LLFDPNQGETFFIVGRPGPEDLVMPPLPVIAAAAGRRLARHLDRLHDTLEGLGERLREVVSEAVGRAVAEAVREAVETLLDNPPESPTRPSYYSPPGRQPTSLWGSSASSSWTYDREEYGYAGGTPRQPYDDELLPAEEEDSYQADPGDQPPRSRPRRWGMALAAGLKAAAWWLGRRPGKNSVLAAATVGVATGIAALFGSPLAATLVGMAGAALALLSVADTVHSGAAVLARERR